MLRNKIKEHMTFPFVVVNTPYIKGADFQNHINRCHSSWSNHTIEKKKEKMFKFYRQSH